VKSTTASIALAAALVAGCRSESRPAARRVDAAVDRSAPPTPTPAAAPPVDHAAIPRPSDAGVFRLGESACVHDPAREGLAASVHGFFSADRLELEVRNVRFSCSPAPSYYADFKDRLVHLRYAPADRAALARCACRHDQFLQITSIPVGDYAVIVEEQVGRDGDANVVARGTVTAAPAVGSRARR
jgi:hypothetical protein